MNLQKHQLSKPQWRNCVIQTYEIKPSKQYFSLTLIIHQEISYAIEHKQRN